MSTNMGGRAQLPVAWFSCLALASWPTRPRGAINLIVLARFIRSIRIGPPCPSSPSSLSCPASRLLSAAALSGEWIGGWPLVEGRPTRIAEPARRSHHHQQQPARPSSAKRENSQLEERSPIGSFQAGKRGSPDRQLAELLKRPTVGSSVSCLAGQPLQRPHLMMGIN